MQIGRWWWVKEYTRIVILREGAMCFKGRAVRFYLRERLQTVVDQPKMPYRGRQTPRADDPQHSFDGTIERGQSHPNSTQNPP